MQAQRKKWPRVDPATPIDTLLQILPDTKEDSFKVRVLLNLTYQYTGKNADEALKYGKQGLDLATKLDMEPQMMIANNLLGNNYYAKYDLQKAMDYFQKTLVTAKGLRNLEVTASMSNNIAAIYLAKGNMAKATELFTDAIGALDDLGNKWEVAKITFNLGNVYFQKNDYPKALEYYLKTQEILEAPGKKVVLKKDTAYFKLIDTTKRLQDLYAKDMPRILTNVTASIGNIYLQQGNGPKAIEALLKALKRYEDVGDKANAKSMCNNIGNVYSQNQEPAKAIEYFDKCLKLSQELGDEQGEAKAYTNMAVIFLDQKNYSAALEHNARALKIFEKLQDATSIAFATNNIGSVYFAVKNYPKALEYYFRSEKIAKELNDDRALAGTNTSLGTIYLAFAEDTTIRLSKEDIAAVASYQPTGKYIMPTGRAAKLDLAMSYLSQASNLASQLQMNNDLKECYKQLSQAYLLAGDYHRAMDYFQAYTAVKDSLYSKDNDKKIMQQQFKYDYDKREDSIKLENEKKELALQKEMELSALRYEYDKKQAAAKSEKEKQQLKYEQELKEQQIEYEYAQKIAKAESEQKQKDAERRQREAITKLNQEKKDALTKEQLKRERNIRYASITGVIAIGIFSFFIFKERKKSDMLLLNILPSSVAKELKKKGNSDAKLFDDVTVLFTDFVSFTKVSERLTPQELVNELHACFKEFDRITQLHGIEKIKTVGDAYLAVSGLPKADPYHATNMIKAAIEIRDFMVRRKAELGDRTFGIRLGVHSGNVVAGIVGIKKFAYDIWGDTVNTAARMEQNSEAGKINISESTYELVKEQFACEYRGEIEAKNKGALKMYFVTA